MRVALLLPPVQSFLMPYCAPAALAGMLKRKHGASTLVIDGGLDWLNETMRSRGIGSPLEDHLSTLRAPSTYQDAWSLRRAYVAAAQSLAEACSGWAPERVELSGRYVPPMDFQTWPEVEEALDFRVPSMFDRYFESTLVPKLACFDPHVVGLSVPFDWMLFPAMRLVRWLKRDLDPSCQVILGGHAIERLWNEREGGFFESVRADWLSVGDGERALDLLLGHLFDGRSVDTGGAAPLKRLPLSRDARDHQCLPRQAGYLASGGTPDFSDLDLRGYLRPSPILPVPVSEGCFFGRCNFCSRQRTDQSVPYVERPGRQVADTIESLQRSTGARDFILAGDIVTHRFLVSLSTEISERALPVNWFCEASFKSTMARGLDERDYDVLRRGGCRIILNGLESGSARIRLRMGCPIDIGDYDRTLDRLVRAGVVPYVTVIVGYPGETLDDLRQTVDYVRLHINESVFAFSRFEIVPGTPLGERLLTDAPERCARESVFAGGLSYDAPDTLGPEAANRYLDEHLPGMFGGFPEFLRSIPVLMSILDKSGAISTQTDNVHDAQRPSADSQPLGR